MTSTLQHQQSDAIDAAYVNVLDQLFSVFVNDAAPWQSNDMQSSDSKAMDNAFTRFGRGPDLATECRGRALARIAGNEWPETVDQAGEIIPTRASGG
jgi:hypothetical protein